MVDSAACNCYICLSLWPTLINMKPMEEDEKGVGAWSILFLAGILAVQALVMAEQAWAV